MNTIEQPVLDSPKQKANGFSQWLLSLFGGHSQSSSSAGASSDRIAVPEEETYVIAPGGYRIRVPKANDVNHCVGEMLPDVARGLTLLPPLPQVVLQLLQEIQNPNSTADSVGAIVSSDPGLTASLIRAVNSAAMGLPRKITAVSEAVSLLGFGVIKAMVVRLRMSDVLVSRSEQGARDAEDLWVHSLAVSYAADYLATRIPDVDRGYVATLALLHDIGKLAILSQLPLKADELRDNAVRDSEISPLAREANLLGVDHAGLGADLAASWKLPPDLVQAIRVHHRFTDAYHPSDPLPLRKALHVVQIANQLAKYCYPYTDHMEVETLPDATFSMLGFPSNLRKLLDRKMIGAISRAIFLADSNSELPITAPRRFLRPLGPEAAAIAIAAPAEAEPVVQIDDDLIESMFWPDIPIFNEGHFPEKGTQAARFTGLAIPAAAEFLIKASRAHQDEMNLPADTHSAAAMVIRSLVPNLMQRSEPDQAIEISQSLEKRKFSLAIRSFCLATWRRLGKALPPLQARRLAEADLAHIINLEWFDSITISSDGATILFTKR